MTDRDREDDRPPTPEEKYRPIPVSGTVEFLSRVCFAGTAGIATYIVASELLHMHGDGAKEVALLNSAVAYYTHEAAGEVVKALNVLYNRCVRVTTLTARETKAKEKHDESEPDASAPRREAAGGS